MSEVAPPLLAHAVLAKVLVVWTEGDDIVPGSSDGLLLLAKLAHRVRCSSRSSPPRTLVSAARAARPAPAFPAEDAC